MEPFPDSSPARLYGSVQLDMNSKISGRIYRIFIFKPDTPPPPEGYPVVIATDGNMTFPILATVNATFLLGGKAALVVGVGYPTDNPLELMRLRTRDLTPPTPVSAIPQRPGLPPAKVEDYGGAENFHRFLTEELLPALAAEYLLNLDDKTLYGHSWGGLFTLGVLFGHPESYRNFIASSPSIWWNKCSVLGGLTGFANKVRSGEAAPRVLITVGGAEQDVPNPLPPVLIDEVGRRAPMVPSIFRPMVARFAAKRMVRAYRMVDNARALAAWLGRIRGGGKGYAVRFHAFDGEDHLTALPASIGRALDFVLRGHCP